MNINKESAHFIKMHLFITKASHVLRRIFCEKYKEYNNGIQWKNNEESAQHFNTGISLAFYTNAKEFTKYRLDSGDTNYWDFTLLADVLKTVKFREFDPKNKEQKKMKAEETKRFERLLTIRNNLSHISNLQLNDEEFNELSNELILIMVSFGESEEEWNSLNEKNLSEIIESGTDVNEENTVKAQELRKLGNQLFKKKKFKESIETYSEALVLKGLNNEEMAVLYSNRSIAYLNLNESESDVKHENELKYRALLDAKQCLELNPFWFKSYYRIGCAYHSLNKFLKAINHLNRALALDPTNEEIIKARDSSRYKLAEEERYGHLDRHLFQSDEDICKQMNSTGGFHCTPQLMKQMPDISEHFNKALADVSRAHLYYHGSSGYKQDFEMAFKLFKSGAEAGNADGMYNLGLMYGKGHGVEVNHNMSIKWLLKAADCPTKSLNTNFPNPGVAEAQHSLGFCYKEGVGVEKNSSIAAEWYTKSSSNGCPTAANNLGHLYQNGSGVERNLKKAEQYFLLSASGKDSNSMANLSALYLELGNLEKARVWYKRAIDNGNIRAKLMEQQFLESVSKREKDLKPLLEFESKNGLNSESLELSERLDRMMKSHIPEDKMEIYDEFINVQKTYKQYLSPTTIFRSNEEYKYDPKIINEFARNRSQFAQRLETALNYFISALIQFEERNDLKFIENLANSIRTEMIVIRLFSDVINKGIQIVNNILKSQRYSKSQIDIDARVCYAYFHSNSLNETIIFLEECSKKYPKESSFFSLCGCLCGFTKDYNKGLELMNKALELSPNDYEIRYNRASMMRLCHNSDPKDVLNAYLHFLETAPKDHRKVPESYYAMALCFHNKDRNMDQKFCKRNITLMKAYYEKGLEAEKIQLPFFLPYDSNTKPLLSLYIKTLDIKTNKSENRIKVPKDPNIATKMNSEILTDPNRMELILTHRECISDMLKMKSGNRVLIKLSTPALKRQKAPKSIYGLKQLSLRDMDPTKDHIYEGFVMNITFIEDPFTGWGSIQSVIQDENGETQRCFIYNFEHEDNMSIVEQTYGFGIKMQLINPYMRMAHDLKPAIRIDDPQCLIEMSGESKNDNKCRYCLKDNAKSRCSRCERAYYCDKNCQTKDWKLHKHKLICRK